MSKIHTTIKRQLTSETLSHAYLVFGHVEINEIKALFKVSDPDYFEILETPIKIAEVRALIHWVSLKPHSSEKRLIYLANVETMTLEAANSLLKVLEEPPPYAMLILQAQRKEKILPTILSRCQLIREEESSEKSNIIYFTPEKLSKMTLKDRFSYIGKLVDEKAPTAEVLNSWESFYREELLQGKDVLAQLNDINLARSLLSTNTSVKLLLENLVLNF